MHNKKTYTTPELTVHGDVKKITLTKGGFKTKSGDFSSTASGGLGLSVAPAKPRGDFSS